MIAQWFRITGLRLISLILAALFVLLLPTVMPPADYGQFALALSIAQTLTAVMLSWPNQALLRFAREEFKRETRLGEAVATRLVLHLVLLIPALVLAGIATGPLAAAADLEPALLRAALLFGLPLISFSDFGVFAGQAANVFRGYGWAPLALRVAQLCGLAVIALGAGGGWATLMVATLTGYGCGAVLAWLSIPRGTLSGFRASWPIARRMLAYARFQPLAILGALLINWMDLWFLILFTDADAVGIYAWSYSVTLVVMTLLVPLSAVLAPRAVDHRLNGDSDAVRRIISAVGGACILLTCAVPLGLSCVSVMMGWVDLGAYSPAITPLLFLLVGAVFQLGSATVEPLVYAFERAAPTMAGVLLAMAAVNALADIVLIPLLGLAGPALATIFAYGTGMLMSWHLAGRLVGGASSPLPFVAFVVLSLPAVAVAMMPASIAIPGGLLYSALLMWGARSTKLMQGLMPVTSGCGERVQKLVGWLAVKESD